MGRMDIAPFFKSASGVFQIFDAFAQTASSAVTSTAAMLAEPLISAIHVAEDQRNVLKPAVVAARVDRDGTPLRGQVLGQLDDLVPEAQPGPPQPQPEHAWQMLELLAGGLEFGNLLEREDAGVELDRPVDIRHRQADRIHTGASL